jgi:hypothetical protein
MYFTETPINHGGSAGFASFSQPLPGLSGAKKALEAVAEVKKQLERNFRADDEPGILDRRRRLRAAFNSVPKLFAPSLQTRLTDKNDELGRLFHYKLATPTRNEMLNILLSKSSEPM